MKRRIPLNPCDYLYFVHHRAMRRRRTGGAVGFLVLDCAGRLDSDATKAALAATLRNHPAAIASLQVGRLLGRPFWRLPTDVEQAACRAADAAYRFDDLSGRPDPQAEFYRLLEARFEPDWELSPGPQVRLEHYVLASDRTCLCLRFPHALMDAGGGQWFLAELGRHSSPGQAGDPPAELAADDQPVRPLDSFSTWQKLKLFVGGFSAGSAGREAFDSAGDDARPAGVRPGVERSALPLLTPDPAPIVESQGIIHRLWPAEMVRRMRLNADRFAPPGPAAHARFLAASVIRALHTLYTERGLHASAYPVSLPLSMTDDNELADTKEPIAPAIDASQSPIAPAIAPVNPNGRRPLPGNYLVAPTLYGRRELVADRAALGRDLLAQLRHYLSRRGHLAQWAMIHYARLLRVWMYDWVFDRGVGLEPIASGFSYYGQIPRPVRRVAGAKVTNLWGTAPLGTPPGWNPIFNKFQGKLNLGFAFNRPAISDELAERFVCLIEQEAFGE